MPEQIKFSLGDIRDNIWRYLVGFIQILTCLLLIAYSLGRYFDLKDFLVDTDKMSHLDNIYIMTDVTSYSHFNEMTDNPEYLPKFAELKDYLFNCDEFDRYVAYEYFIHPEEADNGDYSLEAHFCDKNFTSIYNIVSDDGVPAGELLFSPQSEDYTPILVGHNLKEKYSVGQVLHSAVEKDYIVAGFLAPGSFYYNMASDGNRIYLDNNYLCPMKTEFIDSGDYGMIIYGTHIITDDPKVLERIAAKSDELDLYKFKFKTLKTQAGNIIRDSKISIEYNMRIALLILLLCIACLISFLLTFIDRHIREFAIHLLSGASMRQIATRIIMQTAIPILLANIGAFGLYRDWTIRLLMLGISILICAAVSALPVIKLHVLGINGILKRGE